MPNNTKAAIKFILLIKEASVMVTEDDHPPALLEVRTVAGYDVLGFVAGWERLPRITLTPGCYDVEVDNSVFTITSIHGSVIRLKFYKPCIA